MIRTVLSDAEVDRVFQALADSTRRDIVSRVLGSECSVSELARQYAMSFAAVQKHVAVLERAQLVTKRRRGREQLVRCKLDTVRKVSRLLDSYEELWLHRISGIEQVLSEEQDSAEQDPEEQDPEEHILRN